MNKKINHHHPSVYCCDSQLVEAIKLAKEPAIEYWFKTYQPKLLKMATLKLPSLVTAEEIVQDTFINCLKTITLFKGKSSLLTWMNAVLRHEILDYYRKAYAKKIILTTPLADFILDHQIYDAGSTAETVGIVLKQMLVKNRELLLNKYVDKLSVAQIANRLGVSSKAVESELFRARKEFKSIWNSMQQA